MSRYRYGAVPVKPVVVRPPSTVTGVASATVNLAAKPVKWAFGTAGSLVQWLGGTLRNIGSKL